jgi:hypothetical protein
MGTHPGGELPVFLEETREIRESNGRSPRFHRHCETGALKSPVQWTAR